MSEANKIRNCGKHPSYSKKTETINKIKSKDVAD